MKIRDLAGELQGNAQAWVDLAEAGERLVLCAASSGSGIDWATSIEAMILFNQDQDKSLSGLGPISAYILGASSTGAASVVSDLASFDSIAHYVAPGQHDEAHAAAKQVFAVIDRLPFKQKAVDLLHKFGLDTAAGGKKSPVDHFAAAWAAFERPVATGSVAITSLIPMRQCIDSVVAELIRRRPEQEQIKPRADKIKFIGRQLARDGIRATVIQSLNERYGKLHDELSSAKEAALSREEWRASLQKATLFLVELLECLDPAKIRQ